MEIGANTVEAEPVSTQEALAIDRVSVELRRRGRTVHPVRNVTLSIGRDETVGFVGESGSGKTMLSLAVMRLLPPNGQITSGSIRLGDRDLVGLPETEIRLLRGSQVSMVFQEPTTSLDPLFTVGSQIAEGICAHRDMSRAEAYEVAAGMLERVQIPSPRERLRSYPHELSGGMRQRVMIAMALALRPQVLLADEPTTALDVTVQAQILELIKELQAEMHMSVLLVTHNLALLSEVADRVAVMYAGEIVEIAAASELLKRPRHPYTRGLLDSLPRIDRRVSRLKVVPGRPPDLTRLPEGCPFASRCPRVTERCRTESPQLEPDGDERHLYRCWNPEVAK
jgi:peptide/nickel transport system ATP-binding protein